MLIRSLSPSHSIDTDKDTSFVSIASQFCLSVTLTSFKAKSGAMYNTNRILDDFGALSYLPNNFQWLPISHWIKFE